MKKQDFYFNLPPELIAQYPLSCRSDSNLLVYPRGTGNYQHKNFKDLPDLLEAGDLLVMNDSKVIRGRFYGFKSTGGKVEFLLERRIDDYKFLAHIKANKPITIGSSVILNSMLWQIKVNAQLDGLYECTANVRIDMIIEELGQVPLPPYITRHVEPRDQKRYQTIYAKHSGSVAAPTAGLHFDESLIECLRDKNIQIAYTTLHIGAGTFQPVRCNNIIEHKMHAELYTINTDLVAAIKATKANSKRVIAVGTTALRSLESAASYDNFNPGSRETTIFIYPGYKFKVCDGLITNFHLPASTLFILISAYIGRQQALDLYAEAIAHKYRFYSYGDACALL